MKRVCIFSPATVANVSCGFDALGFALENIGDEITVALTQNPGIKITKIKGATLPKDPKKNVVGVVAEAMLAALDKNIGLEIAITKKVKPGSGLGSSASSAAGMAFAVNELMNRPFSQLELTEFARLGEQLACGSPIADNVAAAIYGGFVLVRSYNPLEIIKLPVPEKLWVAVVHPQIEIKTETARKILPATITVTNSVKQSANLAGLISGLYTDNYGLISRSLEDVIAEPYRKKLIPCFDVVKEQCMTANALGVGISGSGPTIFALCKGETTANKVAKIMKNIYAHQNIEHKCYVSKINQKGSKVL
ncbi:MAG: homoserine kinase [Flavobacteriales bacterium]|nr:MAG: homoserine kinase [Flavobacteriales bacterium]